MKTKYPFLPSPWDKKDTTPKETSRHFCPTCGLEGHSAFCPENERYALSVALNLNTVDFGYGHQLNQNGSLP